MATDKKSDYNMPGATSQQYEDWAGSFGEEQPECEAKNANGHSCGNHMSSLSQDPWCASHELLYNTVEADPTDEPYLTPQDIAELTEAAHGDEYIIYDKNGKQFPPPRTKTGAWNPQTMYPSGACKHCNGQGKFRSTEPNSSIPQTCNICHGTGGTVPSPEDRARHPEIFAAKTGAKLCTICHKPITLSPSAKERAERHGGSPSDYTNIFTTHSQCELDKRKADTSALMAKKREESAQDEAARRAPFKQGAAEGCEYCAGKMPYAEQAPVKGNGGTYYHYRLNDGDPLAVCTNPKYNKYKAQQEKQGMITSDAQLETMSPAPTGTGGAKDDIGINSSPASTKGGVEVLDGAVHHTERPNVNAMREVIETQVEMEVGKPIEQTQAEVKNEVKEITVDKSSGTQLIINIAGKKKTLMFSNVATANAFIKGASAKFGDKFKVVRPDQCPDCGSLDNTAYYKDGRRYDPWQKGQPLWDINKCDDCGKQWPFKFVNLPKSAAPAIGGEDQPVTSGMSDIDGPGPKFLDFREPYQGQTQPSSRVYIIMVGDQYVMVAPDQTYRIVPEEEKATRFDGEFGTEDAKEIAAEIKVSTMSGGNPVRVIPAKTAFRIVKEHGDGSRSTRLEPGDRVRLVRVSQTDGWLMKPGELATVVGYTHKREAEAQPDSTIQSVDIRTDKMVEGNWGSASVPPWFLEYVGDSPKKEGSMKSAGFSFAPQQIGGQVIEQFYPQLQHELISYPNASNAPMPAEMSGDAHTVPGDENGEEMLPGAIEDAFEGMTRIGYVSTSPAGGMGIGRDGKSQVLEGAPLRKENDIRGPMFTEEFYAGTDMVPGSAFASLTAKVAAGDEKNQFGLFLKKVMGEVAAAFIGAFKATTRMPMNKIPGLGEIQLAQIEQPSTMNPAYNLINTGSRVKYLMDKLTDSQVQDCVNDAFAQAAVWHEAKDGGFVYEVFVRAETIDTESMLLKYKFVTGTKDSD
jgi:hypothetical protein